MEVGRSMARHKAIRQSTDENKARIDALMSFASTRHDTATGAVAAAHSELSRVISGMTPFGLPALTGEENTVELLARGQVLCAGESAGAIVAQAMAATAFGNDVILLRSPIASDLAARLGGKCRIVDTTDVLHVVGGGVAGVRLAVVLAEAGQANLPAIRKALASVAGTVLTPSIHGTYDWTRLVRERVTTVNASAAGGNTQLMVLSEDFE
jgi:RHH-type proline utilization regulon transcriptional repressor/proline dehydrogenase/delta 1-pyrroline-5-carboxylate dehydrogenase